MYLVMLRWDSDLARNLDRQLVAAIEKQAKVVPRPTTTNGSSPWQMFGTNATSTVDFNLNSILASSVSELYNTPLFQYPSLLAYYRLEGICHEFRHQRFLSALYPLSRLRITTMKRTA